VLYHNNNVTIFAVNVFGNLLILRISTNLVEHVFTSFNIDLTENVNHVTQHHTVEGMIF